MHSTFNCDWVQIEKNIELMIEYSKYVVVYKALIVTWIIEKADVVTWIKTKDHN